MPLACTLDDDDRSRQVQRWVDLAAQAPPTLTRTTGTFRATYPDSDAQREADIRELVRIEAECCAFVNWTVERTGTDVTVIVQERKGQPNGVDAVIGLFAAS